jgi:hypothetical protein
MEKKRIDEDAETDLLGDVVIDERYNALARDNKNSTSETVRTDSHASATISTPNHVTPDSFSARAEDRADDALIGQMVGNYEITSELGRGGFGSVYKAKDTKLQRFAALKFLRFPLDSDFRKMFTHEAQVIANLGKHPSIVQIYSWGEHQGSQYFALEFLDTSAETMIKRREEPLSVKQALEIVADCAGALHYAHEQGVLHRDVKPANILFDSKTGRAKMCDFGLAKFSALAAGTETRTIAGSPPYMAPEQIVGGSLDARTDVYALGVTLYELLSRELPCKGSSQVEVFDKIRSRQSTPLRVYRPDLSDSVLEIVKQATAFKPEDRFQSAQEMEQACRRILNNLERTGSSEHAGSKSASGRAIGARLRPRTIMAAAAAFVIVLAAAIFAPSLLPSKEDGGSLWPTAVAAAKDQIEAGQYEDAIAWLEDYVQKKSSDDFAHYALGYARLLSSQEDEAEQAFAKVADAGMREEGMAAVEHAKLGADSRDALETAASHSQSDYPAVLLASLDVLNNQYDQAIKRLEAVNEAALNFEWQRRRYNELMARAYYNNGDYARAGQFLGTGVGASDGMAASVNEIYMTKVAAQLDDDRRAKVAQQVEQVKQIAENIKSGGASAAANADEWTSRPLRVRVSPASGNNCQVAIEEGLVDVFSDLMADALVNNDEVPIELVDREYIGDVLYEQQLAQLSKDVDAIQLQKLLGARLMIESEFKTVLSENFVWVKIIDTETTQFTKVESEPFDRRTNARQWAHDLGDKARAAIQKEYPIQGILKNGSNGPQLNVGLNAGVRPGMRFAVHSGPGVEYRLSNVTAVASSNVGPTSTGVTIEPAGASIPASGWYLQQIME